MCATQRPQEMQEIHLRHKRFIFLIFGVIVASIGLAVK